MSIEELQSTIKELAVSDKGILAADESTTTITKRFDSIKVESTVENRRNYRELLLTTPSLNSYISGIIFYEETLKQRSTDNQPFVEFLNQQKIVPGIKVDKGIVPLPFSENENVTQGLDDLAKRLDDYKNIGARFAKWRAVLNISATLPSHLAIKANAEALASYAAICQDQGIVPIVEPELLMDGNHSIERCAQATEATLHTVFHALYRHRVLLEYIILKPSMVTAGVDAPIKPTVEEVATATLKVLRRTVPAAVPTINFLSGGQSPELATRHLNAMNAMGPQPWVLSFSYGRALQDPALKTWQGKSENIKSAQQALYKRAKLNVQAMKGKYSEKLES